MDREGGGNDGREILKSEFNLFAILCVYMCVRGEGGGRNILFNCIIPLLIPLPFSDLNSLVFQNTICIRLCLEKYSPPPTCNIIMTTYDCT